MKKYLIGSLLLLMASASNPFSQNATWKEYVYSAGGFAISSPSEPKVDKGTVQTAGGPVETRTYTVDLGNNLGFVWGVTSGQRRLGNADAMRVLQVMKNGLINHVKGKLVSEEEISIGGDPGVEFEMEAEGFHTRNRYYCLGETLLTVTSIAPLGKPFSADAQRFFDSIRLVKTAH